MTSANVNSDNIATELGRAGLRRRSTSSQRNHQLLVAPCTLLLRITLNEDYNESREVVCFDPSTNAMAKISGPEKNIQKKLLAMFDSNTLISNQSTLHHDSAYFNGNEELVLSGDLGDVIFHQKSDVSHTIPVTSGTKQILALRVITPDAETTSSESEISNALFGTMHDSVTLKSQLGRCSYDKLKCNPAETNLVSDGVYTVNIAGTINGARNISIEKAVVAAAMETLGSLTTQFDHVMMCLPPGTRGENGKWIAYAYLHYNLSVYNNQWCNYVSSQMHRK